MTVGRLDVLVVTAREDGLDALLAVTAGVTAPSAPVHRAVFHGIAGPIAVVAAHRRPRRGRG